MNVIKIVVGCFVAYFIIYTVLKSIAMQEQKCNAVENNIRPAKKPVPSTIEIKSRDLYVKAENLLKMRDIYEHKAYKLMQEVDDIECKLEQEKSSAIRNQDIINQLVSRSLKLQEEECKLEGKIIKINEDLNKIAIEEYKRREQTV